MLLGRMGHGFRWSLLCTPGGVPPFPRGSGPFPWLPGHLPSQGGWASLHRPLALAVQRTAFSPGVMLSVQAKTQKRKKRPADA